MNTIQQIFNLDQVEIEKYEHGLDSKLKLVTAGAGATLIDALKQKGYRVTISCAALDGVPESVLVEGGPTMNAKKDFYEIAGKLHLPYASGCVYMSTDRSDETE